MTSGALAFKSINNGYIKTIINYFFFFAKLLPTNGDYTSLEIIRVIAMLVFLTRKKLAKYQCVATGTDT